MNLNDSWRRAIRTALDSTTAVLVALGAGVAILAGMSQDQLEIFGADPATFAKVGALIVVLTTVVNKVKNSLEDAGVIPALLKAPASDGADPVPNGQVEVYPHEVEVEDVDYVEPADLPADNADDAEIEHTDRRLPDDFPEEQP